MIPPPTPSFKGDRLPDPSQARLLITDELRAFRKRDVPRETEVPEPEEALIAVNHAETIRYLLIDGVAVMRVPPHTERRLENPRPGRYTVSWVDFLGTRTEPTRQHHIPARLEVGEFPDAKADL